jgi:hypothetical protein
MRLVTDATLHDSVANGGLGQLRRREGVEDASNGTLLVIELYLLLFADAPR